MLATRFARCSKAFQFGPSFSSMRVANEIVPVVLRRPILVKVGLAASVVAVFNAKAWCVGSAGLFDDFLDDLMDVDAHAGPVVGEQDAELVAEPDAERGMNAEPAAEREPGAVRELEAEPDAEPEAVLGSDAAAAGDCSGDDEDDDDDEVMPSHAPLPLLRVGELASHDFLGEGTVLAIGSALAIGFESGDLEPADKVRFKFIKRERVHGRGPARYTDVIKIRDVLADALTPLGRETSSGTAGVEEEPTTTYDAMVEAAARPRAFTHGLDGPELAAHERKRKAARLQDAPVRGHNKQGNKTTRSQLLPLRSVLQHSQIRVSVSSLASCSVLLARLSGLAV